MDIPLDLKEAIQQSPYSTIFDKFVPEQWKKINTKIFLISPENEPQTIPELQVTLELLQKLNTTAEFESQYIPSVTDYEYFQTDFLPNLCKFILMNKELHLVEVSDLANRILLQIMLFLLKKEIVTVQASNVFRQLLDCSKNYYQYQNLNNYFDYPFSDYYEIPRLLKEEDLNVGVQVDAVKCDEEKKKKLVWGRAEIRIVEAEKVYVKFDNERKTTGRWIGKKSWEIQPLGTRATDYTWRMNLQVNDIIDCCDTTEVWYTSTILARRLIPSKKHNKSYLEVKVGYRTYCENGEKIDEYGERFSGWSSKYDSWINVMSPIIQQKGSIARKLFTKQSVMDIEPMVDDLNDLLFVEDYKNEKLYGVARGLEAHSLIIVKFVNLIGKANFFDWFISRLNDSTKECFPIEIVTNIMVALGNLHQYYFKCFVNEFIPQLHKEVIKYILESPEENQRKYSKEKLDAILNALGVLLKRYYSLKEKFEIIENLQLNLGLRCVEGKQLQRQIFGILALNELITLLQTNKTYSLTLDTVSLALQQSTLFTQIFSLQTHESLIQRSENILRFMFNHCSLKLDAIETLWEVARKTSVGIRFEIYKVIGTVASVLTSEYVEYIIGKLAGLDTMELGNEEIQLAYSISRYSVQGENYIKQTIQFLWNVIFNKDNSVNEEVKSLALTNFCELMKIDQVAPQRMEIMNNCIQSITEQKNVLIAIQILRKLISGFPTLVVNTQELTQSSVVEILLINSNLISVILKNIKEFKEFIKINQPLINQQLYLKELEERMNFLNFLLNICPCHSKTNTPFLNLELLTSIMDLFGPNALIADEQDLIFKMLKEFDTKNKEISQIIFQSFQQKILFNQQQIEKLNNNGFECFKQLFKSEQIILGNLLRIDANSNNNTNTTTNNNNNNNNNTIYSVTNPPPLSQLSQLKKIQFIEDWELVSCKNPSQFEGIHFFWQLIEFSNYEEIANQSIDYLNYLYVNLSKELQVETIAIREQFMDQLLQKIKSQTQVKSILRLLKILNEFLNETELNGIGTIKSHSTLLSGELITLNFFNHAQRFALKKSFSLKAYQNSCVFELMNEIFKELEIKKKSVKKRIMIERYVGNKKKQLQITERDHGRTLSELQFNDGENLIIRKDQTLKKGYKKQIEFFASDGKITQKAIQAFLHIFNKFQINNLLDSTGVARFIDSCTHDNCNSSDRRVKDIIQKFSSLKNSMLTSEDFIRFYEDSAKTKLYTVWKNLKEHGFNKNFDIQVELSEEECKLKEEELGRVILKNHPLSYQLLFQLLQKNNPEIAELVLTILNRIETYPFLLQKAQQGDFTVLNLNQEISLGNCYYTLYMLQLVEYLTMDVQWGAKWLQAAGLKDLVSQITIINKQLDGDVALQVIGKILKIIRKGLIGFAHWFQHQQAVSANNLVLMRNLSLDVISMVLEIKNEEIQKNNSMQEEPNDQLQTEQNLSPQAHQQQIRIHRAKFFIKRLDAMNEELINQSFTKELSEIAYNSLIKIQLLDSLLEMLNQSFQNSSKTELIEVEKNVIQISLGLLVTLLMLDKECFNQFVGWDQKECWILKGLLFKRCNETRRIFTHALYLLSIEFQDAFGTVLLQILIKNIHNQSQETNKNECNNFYELLCKLLEQISAESLQKVNIDFSELVSTIVHNIQNYQSQEARNIMSVDKQLIGYLNAAEKLFNLSPQFKDQYKEFALYLFYHGLFYMDPNQQEYIKCISQEARQSAYKAIISLTKSENSLEWFMNQKCLEQFLFSEKLPLKINEWKYHPGINTKSSYGYVGIKNLGCICYMIAMLQQFFVCDQFRYYLLMADDKLPQNNVKYEKNKEEYIIDDNILHQLQRMFSWLSKSEKQAFNPLAFCYSFKDFTGQPVNVLIQSDAQEFINMFFDKLENCLKGTPFEEILESIYGGTIQQQLICSGCNSIKCQDQKFYNLSLGIKQKRTLHESLDGLISKDIINDYYCETCKKKIEVTKRMLLNTLPNVLIIHLQRILLNYDTLMNEKINTRLEFPNQLNLKPYMVDTLQSSENDDQQQYEYTLKGIVVHTGTADFGHYYSFINVKEEQWLEFNDSVVKDFDPKNIESQCFGTGEKQQSFLFFINFVVGKDLPKVLIFQEIWNENHEFLVERHVYCSDFFEFALNLSQNLQLPPSEREETQPFLFINSQAKTISLKQKQLCIDFIKILKVIIFKLLLRAHENMLLSEYNKKLTQLLSYVPEFAYDLLEDLFLTNYEDFFTYIIACPEQYVKTHLTYILLWTINTALEYENYDKSSKKVEKIVNFLDWLVENLTEEVAKKWGKSQSYFEFWRDFSNSGEFQMEYMFSKNMMARFIDFYLQKGSPLQNFQDKKYPIGNKYTLPPLNSMFLTLQNMSLRIANPDHPNSKFLKPYQKQYEIPETAQQLLRFSPFYQKLMVENFDSSSIGSLLIYACFDNEILTDDISIFLVKKLNECSSYDDSGVYLDVVGHFLSVKDKFQYKRMQAILGFPSLKQNIMKGYSLITSIYQQIYTYSSTYYPLKGYLELAYYHRNQLEGYTMGLIRKLLFILQQNTTLQQYIIELPACNYCFAKYFDWIKPFLLEQICETQKIPLQAGYGNQNRKELAEGVLVEQENVEPILMNLIKQKKENLIEYEGKTNQQLANLNSLQNVVNNDMFESIYQPYIIGKIVQKDIVQEQIVYEQGNEFIKIIVNQLTTHFIKSIPKGNSNLAFSDIVLKNGYFAFKNIDPESTLFNMIDKFKPQIQQQQAPLQQPKGDEQSKPSQIPENKEQQIRLNMETLIGPMLHQFCIVSNIAVPMILKLQFTLAPDNKNLIDPIFPMHIMLELKPSNNEPQILFTLDKQRPEVMWMKLACSLLSIQFLPNNPNNNNNANQDNVNSLD